MTSSVFPDVNVWLALSSPDHQRFTSAWNWYGALPSETALLFCRITQLGLLRLLTTQSVMGKGTLTQAQAWQAYDRWLEAGGTEFVTEPPELEPAFRSRSGAAQASPKDWADAYLAAFAKAAQLTLVTFDQALAGKAKGAVLLV
jgi:toxin-antitoxin system PIN domain toxin